MNSFNDVWQSVCEYCKNSIHSVAYNTWISTLEPVAMDGDTAVIRSRSDYQKTIVESHYTELLSRGFEEVFGFPVSIRIVVEEAAVTKPSPKPEDSSFRYTFDNFVVGPSNKFAHAAAVAVANDPGHAYNPFFIYGNPGLGKTHLLNAMRNEMAKKFPDLKIVYTQGEPFMNEIIEAIHNVGTVEFREKYRKADVLIIDDIQFIIGRGEATQVEFFNTFEALHRENKQIIISSDRHPKDMKSLDERIESRLINGLTADIEQPDYETRVQIIRSKAKERNLEIPDVVVQYIANQLKSNVRQLEGIVNKLNSYHDLMGEEPLLSVVTPMINEIRKEEMPEPITIERIIDNVAVAYDVTAADICSKKQNAQIANARHIAIYIAREVTGLPLKTIGKSFGRNHATVSASLKKIENDIQHNARLNDTVNDIIKNIQNS